MSRKQILTVAMLIIAGYLFGQTEGYSQDGTKYTTTLQQTPYSAAKTTTQSTTATTTTTSTATTAPLQHFECLIDVSGSLKATQIFYENVSTQSIPDGGINIDITPGVRRGNRLFLGAGIGLHTDFLQDQLKENHNGIIYTMPLRAYEWRLPIYGKVRVFMPTKQTNPFLEVAVGGYVRLKDRLSIDCSEVPGKEFVDTYEATSRGGFFLQIGFGIEYKRLTAALGYRCYGRNLYNDGNYAYLSIGTRLGK